MPAPRLGKDSLMLKTTRFRHALCTSLLAIGYVSSANAVDVAVCTNAGNFTIELLEQQAPLHSANFLEYVDRGFYTGTVFHRVIDGFVVQGGGYTREFRSKLTLDPVQNESRNGVGNSRGTVAAARTGDPHSATSQFYINLTNNVALNAEGEDWGYSVFGQITQGMEVVDEIAALETGPRGPFPTDVTDPLIAVTSMARVVEDRYPGMSDEQRHEALVGDIEAAVASGDNDAVLAHLGEYRAACGELGPELLFQEANALAEAGQNAAATESLGEYLRVADNTSERYLEALSLSRMLDPAAAAQASENEQRLAELTSDCTFPDPPVVPNPESAAMEEMVAAQTAVQDYIEGSNELLECLEEVVEDDDLVMADRELARTAYNDEVQVQEGLAENWNDARVRFLERQEQ
jgi:cyclophilin family peptidyl-prolyl cis-trans isomerase